MFFLVFQVYKKKTEAAKKEYLKQLAAYRASLVSKVTHDIYFVTDYSCSDHFFIVQLCNTKIIVVDLKF